MNKAELIDAIAKNAKLSKADAKTALETITGSATKALKKGDKVTLIGFGTWSVTKRAARTGSPIASRPKRCRCNPGTGTLSPSW